MKSDFLLAITQLSAEKNLPKEVVLGAVEAALVSAYRKEHFTPHQNIEVKINSANGKVEVWAEKTVVQKPEDTRREISLSEAKKLRKDIAIDDTILVESTPQNAGRIAAQTAKQVILQRLHEAEHSAIVEEYTSKEKDIVNGIIQRIEPKQIFVNLGRAEAVLPASEQVPTERYRVGQRIKVLLLEVNKTIKGPRVVVSRSHPDLLCRLFELEIPEIYNGVVEIKSVAREAGYRSKVAVAARQEGIDPVGCCVGLRGIRIQNIANELNGEKIDVVAWNQDDATFIASALSPAQVSSVRTDDGIATVIVPDKHLSLAIGKDGQNARLAAKLTGWRIDIKSVSVVEAVRAALKESGKAKKEAEEEIITAAEEILQAPMPETEPTTVLEKIEEKITTTEEEESIPEPEAVEEEEPVTELEEEIFEEREEEAEPVDTLEPIELVPLGKSSIRFAEDIFTSGSPKSGSRQKRKKKKQTFTPRDKSESEVRAKKVRQPSEIGDEEEY